MTGPSGPSRLLGGLLARPWIALAAALVVHAALWLAVQRDIHTADPLYYATNAHNLAFHPAELIATRDQFVFVMRLGLTAPIALVYRLFGVSTLATNPPCLLAGLAIVAIAYAAATPHARLLAVAFAAVCTPLVLDGRELTPDLPCAAAMAASIGPLEVVREQIRASGAGAAPLEHGRQPGVAVGDRTTCQARRDRLAHAIADPASRSCQRYAVQSTRTSCVHDHRTRRRFLAPLPQHDLA